MPIGIVGQKCGMTRVFTKDGISIPVTVVMAMPNYVAQIKTLEIDGYSAIQVAAYRTQDEFGSTAKRARVSKPLAKHCAKARVPAGHKLYEFRVDDPSILLDEISVDAAEVDDGKYRLGSKISVSIFEQDQLVDVTGVTKGKGFAGVVKRHNFSTQDASHGNSLAHRAPGSIGQNQSPRKVFKGKKMAGQLGNVQRTVQNQKIINIDLERNLLFVAGAVPGSVNGFVVVKPAVKMQKENNRSK